MKLADIFKKATADTVSFMGETYSIKGVLRIINTLEMLHETYEDFVILDMYGIMECNVIFISSHNNIYRLIVTYSDTDIARVSVELM